MDGIVIKSTGNLYDVQTLTGQTIKCRLRGNFRLKGMKTTNPLSVGDRVFFLLEGKEKLGLITDIEDRKNCIIRKSVKLSKQRHIIASNVDKAFLVLSLVKPRTPQGFIDRFLISAEAYKVEPILVFNKHDLYEGSSLQEYELLYSLYQSLGYTCFTSSALTGLGMEELKLAFKGFTSLLAGNSGVGKSAIINFLDPSLQIKTGDISDYHSKGKHTTTFAQMHPLPFGGYIIDSPGIKEFGMVDFITEEISLFFPEMRDRKKDCRFNNCSHVHEPQCAILEAVEKGEIHRLRYTSYLNILNGEEVEEPGLLENKNDRK